MPVLKTGTLSKAQSALSGGPGFRCLLGLLPLWKPLFDVIWGNYPSWCHEGTGGNCCEVPERLSGKPVPEVLWSRLPTVPDPRDQGYLERRQGSSPAVWECQPAEGDLCPGVVSLEGLGLGSKGQERQTLLEGTQGVSPEVRGSLSSLKADD